MVKKLLFFISSLFVLESSAQVFTWAAMDSLYSEGGIDLAKDDSGNVYVASVYDYNINLCKYDPGHQLEWERRISTAGISDLNVGICCDHNGNIYITSYFSGDLSLDTDTVLTQFGGNMFLLKLNPQGLFQWVRHTTGSQTWGRKVSCDANNNVYVAGQFTGYAYFDTTYINTVTMINFNYVAKYSCNGDFRWVNHCYGADLSDHYIGFKTDAKGNSYLSGCIRNTVYFDSISITSWGYPDAYLAKIDSSGHWLWARHAGWSSQDESLNLGLDSSGNVYLKGFFDSPTLHIGAIILNNGSGDDFFVAKYDSSGNVLWALRGWKNGMSPSFCVDKAGNSYLNTNSKFIYKYDTNGNFVYLNSTSAYNSAMIADDSGSVYITGSFMDSVTFGNTHLNAIYTHQSFVAKLEFPMQPNVVHFSNQKNEWLIYPNPSGGLLNLYANLETKTCYTLCFRNTLGEVICTEKFDAVSGLLNRQLDAATFPKGIYFVELSDGKHILETKKIMIQ